MWQIVFYGVWAYWLLCYTFPMWHPRWMRRYRLLFYAGTLGLWALWCGSVVLTEGWALLGVGQTLALVSLQVFSARLTLWVAYTCYAYFIAPLERKEDAVRGSVRVRRVVYLLICAGCAAFVLPDWTQTLGRIVLSMVGGS